MKKIAVTLFSLIVAFSMTACAETPSTPPDDTTPSFLTESVKPDENPLNIRKVDLGDGEYFMEETDEKGNLVKNSYYSAEGVLELYNTYEYDENDNLIKETNYDAEGNLLSYTETAYNDRGMKTEKSYFDSDGSCVYYETYKYDENNNCTEEYYYQGTVLDYYVISEYNDRNLPVHITCFLADDSISSEYEYQYDNEGNLVSEIRSDGAGAKDFVHYERNGIYLQETCENAVGEIIYKRDYENGVIVREYFYENGVMTYFEETDDDITVRTYVDESGKLLYSKTYDAGGNTIAETYYDDDASVRDYYTFEYNDDNYVFKQSYHNAAGVVLWYNIYEYDIYGNVVKDSCYLADELESYKVMEYDGQGNEIKNSVYNKDGELMTYRIMQYDDYGNLIAFEDYDADGKNIN